VEFKFIPIIGSISAGKSTFLNAFLGINNILQSGPFVNTKFVTLIKNSKNLSFYHAIPKYQNDILSFIKDGEELKEENEIKKKIEENNENVSKEKENKDNIFYILETPIKNLDNFPLFQNCYFMDIPGLNENDTEYIDIIFSLIKQEYCLFEIIVFDSTSIGSDKILNILNALQKKNALLKKNNLFILNKIDECKNVTEENVIESFKKDFYDKFEDEKKKDKIKINIYKNYLVPMNSLSYLAETLMDEDFQSFLIFELYNYLEFNNKTEFSKFFDYIKRKVEALTDDLKIEDKEIKKIKGNDLQIIKKTIDIIQKLFQSNANIHLGLNLKDKDTRKEIKKIYYIHKEKKFEIIHSERYLKLKEAIQNIHDNCSNHKNNESIIESNKKIYNFNLINDKKTYLLTLSNYSNNIIINIILEDIIMKVEYEKIISIKELWDLNNFFKIFNDTESCLNGLKELFEKELSKIEKNDKNLKLIINPILSSLKEIIIIIPKKIPDIINMVKEMDYFFKDIFNEIDKEKELTTTESNYKVFRDSILCRKIRIPFIGNISVGKSTVLNCIIGEKILPSKGGSECTYRGIIIKYKDEDEFKLYKAKLISGVTFWNYSFFQEDKEYYCKGVDNIRDYLNNKNNDKKMNDDDAYIIITGKLKIFEFINLDKKIMDMIEFIDLPGIDNENNEFIQNYYDKILEYTNCCIYVMSPEDIKDPSNLEKIKYQIKSDAKKLLPSLRNKIINSCIFLINKSDLITEQKEENQMKKIGEPLFKAIKQVMKELQINEIEEKNINISYFSGENFLKFLEFRKYYVEFFEKDPYILLNYLYENWKKKIFFKKNKFKRFFKKEINLV
jgi:GTPase Era involved in 16S rRNA processing